MITATARRHAREIGTGHDAWRDGVLSAVSSLRHFAEIEGDPGGKTALLRAADAIESVHKPSQ